MVSQVVSQHSDITDVSGIRVGHFSDFEAKTGVTIILPPDEGAVAGVYIGGSATSTRQMDSLLPAHSVDRVHGICLCGGSAFGLDASGGVLSFLERNGIGFHVVGRIVPIVPSAAIFDLNIGDGAVRPDFQMGFLACRSASSGKIEQGSVGAGTGATVGKLFGIERAMKGGLGSASVISGGITVGTLVVVNSYGDVTDSSGQLLAGLRLASDSLEPANSANLLKSGEAVSRRVSVENTTLTVVAVNAKLSKMMACKIAAQATMCLSNVIRPFHTQIDGDLTIVMSVGDEEADPNRISLLAAEVMQEAVVNAVKKADGMGVIPAWGDMAKASLNS
jgi:L-aminopeptidase/D-esterase-like protein